MEASAEETAGKKVQGPTADQPTIHACSNPNISTEADGDNEEETEAEPAARAQTNNADAEGGAGFVAQLSTRLSRTVSDIITAPATRASLAKAEENVKEDEDDEESAQTTSVFTNMAV